MGISAWQLLIIAAIVVLIFGTKKRRNMGTDVGGAIKNFRSAMKEEDQEQINEKKTTDETKGRVIEADKV